MKRLICLSVFLLAALVAGCGKEWPLRPPEKPVREDVVYTTSYVSFPAVYDSSTTLRFFYQPQIAARLNKIRLPSNLLKESEEFPIFRYTALADSTQDTFINASQGRYMADKIQGLTFFLGAYEDPEFKRLAPLDTFINEIGYTCYRVPKGRQTLYLEYTAKIKKVLPGGTLIFYINDVGKEVLTSVNSG